MPLRGVRSRSGFFVQTPVAFDRLERVPSSPWLTRFAWLTVLATWGLVGIGGLVTSKGVGMAVPDWPTSYGYNMFALPLSTWLTGGVFHEHTHRLWASEVGFLTLVLTCWLFGGKSRPLVRWLGVLLIVAGLAELSRPNGIQSSIHIGIHGVALLAASFFWPQGEVATKPLRWLGLVALLAVLLQGLLGGLRVVLDARILADVRLGTAFGILHGCLGQVFLVILVLIAVFTTRWWGDLTARAREFGAANGALRAARAWIHVATAVIFCQLLFGAAMRHQHAGLAVPDFPLAHGRLYPATDAAALQGYNAARNDHREFNRITAFQIHLHMMHRFTGLALAVLVPVAAWKFRLAARRAQVPGSGLAAAWAGLIVVQATLGVLTVLWNKPADVATAHVMVGALVLGIGVVLHRLAKEFSIATEKAVMQSPAHLLAPPTPQTQP